MKSDAWKSKAVVHEESSNTHQLPSSYKFMSCVHHGRAYRNCVHKWNQDCLFIYWKKRLCQRDSAHLQTKSLNPPSNSVHLIPLQGHVLLHLLVVYLSAARHKTNPQHSLLRFWGGFRYQSLAKYSAIQSCDQKTTTNIYPFFEENTRLPGVSKQTQEHPEDHAAGSSDHLSSPDSKRMWKSASQAASWLI